MPRKNYVEECQDIVERYRYAGQEWPATTVMVAAWAYHEGLWEPQESDLIHRLADDLAQAMREDYYTDPHGRRVRAKHAARMRKNGKQLSLWDDLRTMTREHAEASFRQSRNQIVGDCTHLKRAMDSYNDNYNPGPAIPLVLDFTQDVAENEAMEDGMKTVDSLTENAWPTSPEPPAWQSESVPQASAPPPEPDLP